MFTLTFKFSLSPALLSPNTGRVGSAFPFSFMGNSLLVLVRLSEMKFCFDKEWPVLKLASLCGKLL